MPNPVTRCERSYYEVVNVSRRIDFPDGQQPAGICDNPAAPCSVRNVAHEPHDWLAQSDTHGNGWWRHCTGVSLVDVRASG